MPFHIDCTASAGKKPPADLWRWLQTGLLFLLALHGLQEAFAQQARDRSIIKQGYFSTFRFLHSGQYEDARKGFEQATRRGIKAGADFSSSSFCNNGSEWVCGLVLGFCAGLLGTAWLSGGNDKDQLSDQLLPTCFLKFTALSRVCGGALLGITVLASAVLFGQTWDNVPVSADPRLRQHDDREDMIVTVILILFTLSIPAVVATQ